METVLGLVAAALGVALVPSLFSETTRDGVVFRELSGAGSPVPYEALACGKAITLPRWKPSSRREFERRMVSNGDAANECLARVGGVPATGRRPRSPLRTMPKKI